MSKRRPYHLIFSEEYSGVRWVLVGGGVTEVGKCLSSFGPFFGTVDVPFGSRVCLDVGHTGSSDCDVQVSDDSG